jgi:hypothetical protein
VSPPLACSGETSQPGGQLSADSHPADPDRKILRMESSSPFCRRSAPVRFGLVVVGLLPRVLSLTPQVTFTSQADDSCRNLPLLGPYCPSVVIAGLSAPSWRNAQSAGTFSVFTLRLRHRVVSAADFLSKTAGAGVPTLARSSNSRLLTDCVRPLGSSPRTVGRHSASRLVSPVPPLVCRVVVRLPLAAWPPDRNHGRDRSLPREPVTSACVQTSRQS